MSHHWPPLLLLLLSCLSAGAWAQDEYCYSSDADPYDLHAVYTSYFEMQNADDEPIQFEGCSAISYWAFTRHGARNPRDYEYFDLAVRLVDIQERIMRNYDDGTVLLCDEDLSLLASWSYDLTLDQADELTPSGTVEQEQLGRRFARRFPDLLGQPYSEDLFRVRHTAYERTEKSAEAYVGVGVFPGEDVYIPPPIEDDPLLRPYDSCTKWLEEVGENPATAAEQELFEQEQPVLDTLANVNRRTGFVDDGAGLTFDEVRLMYDMCRYDRAARPGLPSAWCSPFEEDDMVVMEYHQDLFFWYETSYGNDINREVACPLVKDVADTFNMPDDEMPAGTFYFAHGTGQLLFTTALGLYEDEVPLLHDNFEESTDRLFRTSFLKPFSNNYEFVLYDCDEGGAEPARRLLALRDEVRVSLPGCDKPLCGWDQFQDTYRDVIACPFDEICENE